MEFLTSHKSDGIATLVLSRGRVNALNGVVIDQFWSQFKELEGDHEVRAVVLTGQGKFFSFGFDIPEFLSLTKEQFADYLKNFTDLYRYLFLFPKPVVAALNGHTIAGGCMLALACDYRVMVTGKAKISLNEISFGSSVFAGSTEMLRFWVGSAQATNILYSGAMYPAEEARSLGLVHEAVPEGDLTSAARRVASDFGSKHSPAFTSMKLLLRNPIAEEIMRRESESIREFVDIWYSEITWANLHAIQIR